MNLPKGSKLKYKGILFDIYQREQKLYDGTYKTYEKIVRFESTNVIPVIDDKIMIIKQEQPTRPLHHALVGGIVDEGEKHLDAVKREMLEETGFQANNWELLGEWYGTSKMYAHESLYIATNCEKISEQNLDGGEIIEPKLVSYDDFLQLCRDKSFVGPMHLRSIMYEALLEKDNYNNLKKRLFQ